MAGYVAFTALHVPVYALLFMGLLGDEGKDDALIAGLDAFFLVHVLLHVVFRSHPDNRFGSAFSCALIPAAGACGLLDLVVSLQGMLPVAGSGPRPG